MCYAKENCVPLEYCLNKASERLLFMRVLFAIAVTAQQSLSSISSYGGLLIWRSSSYCLTKQVPMDARERSCSLKCCGQGLAYLDLHVNTEA